MSQDYSFFRDDPWWAFGCSSGILLLVGGAIFGTIYDPDSLSEAQETPETTKRTVYIEGSKESGSENENAQGDQNSEAPKIHAPHAHRECQKELKSRLSGVAKVDYPPGDMVTAEEEPNGFFVSAKANVVYKSGVVVTKYFSCSVQGTSDGVEVSDFSMEND